MGCSPVWVTHASLGQNHIKMTWVAHQCGLLMPFWVKTISKVHRLLMPISFKTILKGMGYSSVWVAYAILGQSSMNRHGLLFSLGYSCHLGQTRMNGHGLLFSLGCSCHFGPKPYQKDMGCSSVWVAHAHFVQNNIKRHGLLMPFWVKPVRIDMGCSSVCVTHAIWVKPG